MKIERLLAITILLLNRRKVTANELAEHFEVSLRTVYRDLDSLNNAGIPVISSQGYDGGFSIPDSYKLSRQLLSYNDMVSILTSLKGLNTTLKNSEIDSIIQKITALIPADKKEQYKKQSDSIIIDIGPWGKSHYHEEVMQLVHHAIFHCQVLLFQYTGANGIRSKREVEPHTLIFKSFQWYLLAFCRLRSDFRFFKLSRIRNQQLKTENFKKKQINTHEYLSVEKDQRAPVEITLRFSQKIKIRVEEMFHEQNLTYNDDGSITATLSIPEDDWISSFILSFGEHVEVISPPHWRNRVQEKIKNMEKVYRNLT